MFQRRTLSQFSRLFRSDEMWFDMTQWVVRIQLFNYYLIMSLQVVKEDYSFPWSFFSVITKRNKSINIENY